MDKEVYYGDGVVTGHGLIRGRKVKYKLARIMIRLRVFTFDGIGFCI